ncbi:aspartate carbamoyltransferase [Arcanobacterium wilhelmae]|nr:aspartate carbamoyltransferase [Arcanobacterium wilhelmae]WFN90114.1 aspartate carbamoyltransferase [Arcanobacterium wilhelmae]
MRHVIDVADLTFAELSALIAAGERIAAEPGAWADRARGKVLASLFFEPSTRTRLSFEIAMARLGGTVISMADGAASSASKGETLADTARVISGYADIVAMRHPKDGAALVAAEASRVPLVNAGDGGHFHPTQTLADLLTIHREFGRCSGLTVAVVGDLLYGRTVHSLLAALSRFSGNEILAVSPAELRLPEQTVAALSQAGVRVREVKSLEEAVASADVVYMTRVQRERFGDPVQYERLRDAYVLDASVMAHAREHTIVMHPLPRVNEIAVDVDSDPRARYFEQAENGMFMRMALIDFLLREGGLRLALHGPRRKRAEGGTSFAVGTESGTPASGDTGAPASGASVRPERLRPPARVNHECPNPRCVTRWDRGAVAFAYESAEGPRCGFCDTRL